MSSAGLPVFFDLSDPERVSGGPFTSVDHYIQAKALAGDPSDGIPGVVGVGIKTAAKIVREHGSIETPWAKHDAGESIKGVVVQRAAGPQYRSTYFLNLQLIDWRLAPALSADLHLHADKPDRTAAAKVRKLWGLPATAVQSLGVSSQASQKVAPCRGGRNPSRARSRCRAGAWLLSPGARRSAWR